MIEKKEVDKNEKKKDKNKDKNFIELVI